MDFEEYSNKMADKKIKQYKEKVPMTVNLFSILIESYVLRYLRTVQLESSRF